MKIPFMNGVWKRKDVDKKINDISHEDIKSIAIIRHAALGDMVLTRNFIIETRKLFPNAKITLSIISNYTRGIPEDLVDRVHIIHGTNQRGAPIGERIKTMRELGYHDLLFDLAAGNRSFLTCFFNPAKLKIGFPYRKIRAWMFYDIAVCRNDLSFEVNDMLKMLLVFGAKTTYPHVYNMPGVAIQRDKPFVVYFTGASEPAKCWPRENYAELIKQMSALYPDKDHLVLGGLKDWERADKVLDLISKKENIYAIEADTIEETASLMKGADLLISNDTGIRHVAIVCNTPTVGVFPGRPYRYWPRYSIHDAVFPEENFGVVSVEEVKDACIKLLSNIN
ncbi:MAG: glycosyltransferase family 9 protein [Gammaproteobacteria bacterium]|nr:glycosyltransferase family 9 protein [Gammaproteobacteria bacterium]